MVTIENEHLVVQIKLKGAEIASIQDKETGHEYIWQADPAYWNRHSPVLFPIVGSLKDGQMVFAGETYEMSRHGFARDMEFTLQNQTDVSASFYLKSSATTLEKYPFEFSFQINYILQGNTVTVSYEVLNPSSETALYYSVGAHPAFNVSQDEATEEFDRVSLEFIPEGPYSRLPLTEDGLINATASKYERMDKTYLTHDDFKDDALVYQVNQKTEMVLRDEPAGVTINVNPSHMEFVGIWSPYPKRAPFVCIEPWTGIADTTQASGEFTEKYSILQLAPNDLATHGYTMTFTKDV